MEHTGHSRPDSTRMFDLPLLLIASQPTVWGRVSARAIRAAAWLKPLHAPTQSGGPVLNTTEDWPRSWSYSRAPMVYRGTSLKRNRTPLGPYRRPMPCDVRLAWSCFRPPMVYRGTSLIRKRTPLGPCRRPMPVRPAPGPPPHTG